MTKQKREPGGGLGDGQAGKKAKQATSPFDIPPSSLFVKDMKIREPFLKWLPMKKRDISKNVYVGGRCDFEALDWLLKTWVLPALDVVSDTFGYNMSREMQTRLSNTILPCLITMLAKQESEDRKSTPTKDLENLNLFDMQDSLTGAQLVSVIKSGLKKMDVGLESAAPFAEQVQSMINARDKAAGQLLELLGEIDAALPATTGVDKKASPSANEEPGEEVTFRANDAGLPGEETSGAGSDEEESEEEDMGSEAMDQDDEQLDNRTQTEAQPEDRIETDAKAKITIEGLSMEEQGHPEEPDAAEQSTPRDALPIAAPTNQGESPDSSYGPTHRHEDGTRLPNKSTMDLATYVFHKKSEDETMRFLKNDKECKGEDTIGLWQVGKGNVNQVAVHSAEHSKYNLKYGRYSSIYGQGYNVKKWAGTENVPMATVKIGANGKLASGAVADADAQIRQWWKSTNPGTDFDESLLITKQKLDDLIEVAEKALRTEYNLPPDKARIPAGTYELGEFYSMENTHQFLTLPLEAAPGLATYAYLESELLIGLGKRVTTWSKREFQTRIANDLQRRIAKQARILKQGSKEALKEDWLAHRNARNYDELILPLL